MSELQRKYLPLQPSCLFFLLFFADLARALDYIDQCPKESFCQIALIYKLKTVLR